MKFVIRSRQASEDGVYEVIPRLFESRHDAQVWFEDEGMDYDYYEIIVLPRQDRKKAEDAGRKASK